VQKNLQFTELSSSSRAIKPGTNTFDADPVSLRSAQINVASSEEKMASNSVDKPATVS